MSNTFLYIAAYLLTVLICYFLMERKAFKKIDENIRDTQPDIEDESMKRELAPLGLAIFSCLWPLAAVYALVFRTVKEIKRLMH